MGASFLKGFVLFLSLVNVYSDLVLFKDYCMNGKTPKPFPISGEQSSGTIIMSKAVENGTWYNSNMNCSVTFTAEDNHHILLTFSNISLRNSSMDNLTIIYDSDKASPPLSGQQVCSNENCNGLKFDSGDFNNMTLMFQSANTTVPANVTGFQAHYTVYNLAAKNGACKNRKQFLCENNHCISNLLVCDGHNNCGDMSDETKCVIPISDTIWGIVAIVVAIVSILIFVPLFCCLAMYGTRSIVKTVTLSTPAVPLRGPLDSVETSGLLTSSEILTNCWPGTSYERRNSFSYGTSQNEPSASYEPNKKVRSMSEDSTPSENKVL